MKIATLGPKGMDKMLVDSLNNVTITNDGVTILEEISVEHPTAKMIVEVAKTQEDEVGDGTTTAVVFAGELLKNAEVLLEQHVHPTVITRGYRIAAEKAQEILNKIAVTVTAADEDVLKKVAMTAMTGKGAESSKELLAELIVDGIKLIADTNVIDIENIKIEKKVGGGVENSELIRGIVIDKEAVHGSMPKKIKDAKVALLDAPIEIKNTETDAKIQISSPDQMDAFLKQEEKMIKDKTQKIIDSGATVVLCQKGIDDLAQHYLAKANVFACRRVKKSDMEKLARATGARVVNTIEDLSSSDLGSAGVVEEVKVGDEDMTYIRDCPNPKAVTLLLRGGTQHVIDEVERAAKDAMGDIAATLRVGKAVGGAGAPEMELARQLKEFANSLSGREQLAVNAFADAMEVIPRTLAENAGLDPIDVLTELRSQHDQGKIWGGIDIATGKVLDAWESGIIEPLKIKTQAIKSASEVTELILRIDDVIAGAAGDGGAMPPGGMGGMPQGMM